jgi:hypothetical protein
MRCTKFAYKVVTISALILLGLGWQANASQKPNIMVSPVETQFESPVIEMIGTAYLALISGPGEPIVTIPVELPFVSHAGPTITMVSSWCESIDIAPSKPATEIVAPLR